MSLGLSPEAIAHRRQFVCAGDVAAIMRGEWRQVWRVKRGLAEEEDLSAKLPVQLGSYTEPFNLAWCARQEGRRISYFSDNPLMRDVWNDLVGQTTMSEFTVSARHPWMACSLDALSTTRQGLPCVLDAKHVGQFRYDELVARYTPASTHQAIVCNTRWWALSVLVGNSKLEWIEQEVDPWYEDQVISETRAFWDWVERGEEPMDRVEAEPAPKPTPRLRRIDLTAEEPNWKDEMIGLARTFISTEGAHKKHVIVREQIGKLVPEDVGELVWGKFSAKRTRANALVIKFEREKDDAGAQQ